MDSLAETSALEKTRQQVSAPVSAEAGPGRARAWQQEARPSHRGRRRRELLRHLSHQRQEGVAGVVGWGQRGVDYAAYRGPNC